MSKVHLKWLCIQSFIFIYVRSASNTVGTPNPIPTPRAILSEESRPPPPFPEELVCVPVGVAVLPLLSVLVVLVGTKFEIVLEVCTRVINVLKVLGAVVAAETIFE
jgi:hypothetical protein